MAALLLRSQKNRASSQAQFRSHSTVPLLGLSWVYPGSIRVEGLADGKAEG
jgi:hypothetical protein